jgi:hypothetical protein
MVAKDVMGQKRRGEPRTHFQLCPVSLRNRPSRMSALHSPERAAQQAHHCSSHGSRVEDCHRGTDEASHRQDAYGFLSTEPKLWGGRLEALMAVPCPLTPYHPRSICPANRVCR